MVAYLFYFWEMCIQFQYLYRYHNSINTLLMVIISIIRMHYPIANPSDKLKKKKLKLNNCRKNAESATKLNTYLKWGMIWCSYWRFSLANWLCAHKIYRRRPLCMVWKTKFIHVKMGSSQFIDLSIQFHKSAIQVHYREADVKA